MSYEVDIARLESEWSLDGGFFGRIRQGLFSRDDFQRALNALSAMRIPEDAEVPRRVVSLLWYIPSFMEWQAARIKEEGQGDPAEYARAITQMRNEVERLLGVP